MPPSKPEDPLEIERHEVTQKTTNAVVPRVSLGQGDEIRLIFAVQQCEKQLLRSRSTAVSSVEMQRPMT